MSTAAAYPELALSWRKNPITKVCTASGRAQAYLITREGTGFSLVQFPLVSGTNVIDGPPVVVARDLPDRKSAKVIAQRLENG